jgi:adenine-specific DNA-methyltransferase
MRNNLMARKSRTPKRVETLRHEEVSRRNIPTAEFHSIMDMDQRDPEQVAYARRNRDLGPQLFWRGKDEQDWSDLVVRAPRLYIQKKVQPKMFVDVLMRRTETNEKTTDPQPDLLADLDGLPNEGATTEFYPHDANWTNGLFRLMFLPEVLRCNFG